MTIFENYPLIAALSSILFAQFVKFPISFFTRKKGAHLSLMTSTGGMPSSHSAAVTSLITALGLEYGFASPLVAIATTFGVIVMFDAMAVRRQSGEQGILLSQLFEEQLRDESTKLSEIEIDDDEPIQLFNTEENKKLIIKKYLGHKPVEVFGGAMTGIVIAILLRFLYF